MAGCELEQMQLSQSCTVTKTFIYRESSRKSLEWKRTVCARCVLFHTLILDPPSDQSQPKSAVKSLTPGGSNAGAHWQDKVSRGSDSVTRAHIMQPEAGTGAQVL